MDKRKESKNNKDECLSSSDSHDQVVINMPPAVDQANVVYLPDANLGATETEEASSNHRLVENLSNVEPLKNKHMSFDPDDQPSTSSQTAERRPKLEDSFAKDQLCKATIPIKGVLYRVSYDLNTVQGRSESHPTVYLQIPEFCELGTQTSEVHSQPRRLRLDLTTRRPDPNRPPCERQHHTITISGNNLPPNPPQLRRTICARIGRYFCDFVAAFCLCLQVNKDCVFCLGFFVAFVISASFLTAFFYRTISFTSSPVRVAVPLSGTTHYELATLKFNGGYYYIYNNNQHKFV
ncbi:uncharacterized protein LOC108105805 [Drosophila eugracilis]|uniref:uncharacterized protein LOC108105805 n=1 Tax=Drosophila eugracilis TaxID=29029 RepID=UPI001BD92356|nr:uncharacterized protein LOC108105805 [Drosophila eugracilis]